MKEYKVIYKFGMHPKQMENFLNDMASEKWIMKQVIKVGDDHQDFYIIFEREKS